MGKSFWESRVFELPFEFLYYLDFQNIYLLYHQFKMRAFIILACIGVVFAGEDMFGMKKMQKSWMKHKAMESCFGEHMDDDNESPFGSMGASKYSMDNDDSTKFKFFEKMMKSMNRNKRASDDLFELGDRLTEKLKAETVEMQGKLGNASCVLKELDIIDQNEDIDVAGMVQSIERGEWGEFPDEWLKEQHIKDCRNCATFANSIPKSVFEECAYGEKWGRIMMFFHCENEAKFKCCMNHDMKLKLKKSFGSLESLEEATGLPEYQLLPMTIKLLNEQMDMFM